MTKNIRLVGLDLDGTVLTEDKRITEATKRAIAQAIESGVTVVLATGRTNIGVPDAMREMPGLTWCVTANGAAVYDLKSGECLEENCLTQAQAEAAVEIMCSYPVVVDAFINGSGWLEEGRRAYMERAGFGGELLQRILATHRWVPSLPAAIREERPHVRKVTGNFPPEVLAYRAEAIERLKAIPDLLVVSGGGTNLEATHKSANKGEALMRIAAKLGISREEVMAIGDSENDVSMVKAAGLGIAMGNAEACVKAAAADVTGSNEEDGVAQALEKYVLHPQKEEWFSPLVFAGLLTVLAASLWTLFARLALPLTISIFDVVVSTRVQREWYLILFFLNVIFYLCLTPKKRGIMELAVLGGAPFGLYGLIRMACLGMGGLLGAAAIIAGGVVGGMYLARKAEDGAREKTARLWLVLGAVCLVTGALYFGAQKWVGKEEAQPLIDRGQSEYLTEGNWRVLEALQEERFAAMTQEERVEALGAIAMWEAYYLKLEPVTVTAEHFERKNQETQVVATYQNQSREICMNAAVIAEGDPKVCLEALCHELYHAYQWALTDASIGSGIADRAKTEYWAGILNSYQSNESAVYEAYYEQTAEVTARKYAAARTEELFKMAECMAP